jgi:hypothetical protein
MPKAIILNTASGRQEYEDVVSEEDIKTTSTAHAIPRGDGNGDIHEDWIPESVRSINISEPDGTQFTNVLNLQFPNGSLTNLGGGIVDVAVAVASGGSITVREVDASPSIGNVTAIEFPDGSVSDQGSGVARVTFGSSGGTILGLSDTPASYSGQAGKVLTVANTEDGMIFGSSSSSGLTDIQESMLDLFMYERYW